MGSTKWLNAIDDTSILLDAKPESKTFNYDFVADESVSQETIFHKIAQPIADSWLEGYNGTIFAYGQTGSGKTYTIQGPGFDDVCMLEQADQDRGIIPRSFEYMFNKLDQMMEEETEESKFEYLVRTSYLEIYNEQIMDLLNSTNQNLQVREDIKKGVYVEGLIEEISSSAHDMLNILKQGALRRHTGATLMNKESSRSHSVLSTTIETKVMKNGLFNIKISKFHIIDLAGSERAKNTEAVGSRLKEAGMINKSLSTLGNVINSLVDVSLGKSRHVHYRDSKLTFLLRDSLGGNAKTLIIANISPASVSFGETLSTLKFAQRAKLIKNKAIINEDSSGTVAILKDEIKRLKLAMTKMKLNSLSKNKQIWNKWSEKFDKKPNQTIAENALNAEEATEEMSLWRTDSINESTITSKTMNKLNQLESLLKKNLSQMSQLQGFYDKEIYDKDQLIKRIKVANENYERQQARDNMIIKFRDSTISRFGNLAEKLNEEECSKEFENLKHEIQLLQLQLNENPKLVKSCAEIEELKHEISKMKKESDTIEDSYLSLYKSSLEFIDELKEYLDYNEEERQIYNNNVIQEYIKKIESLKFEVEQAESQTEGYKELLSSNQAEYEVKVQELENELNRAKHEIREIREKEITELRDRLIREEQEKYEIHAKNKSLHQEKQTLHEETKHLYEERENLHNEKSYLQNEKNTLQIEKNSLLSEKSTLQLEKNNLQSEKTHLLNEKHSLISEKESLKIEKYNIEKLFEQMKSQYLDKENEYKELVLSLTSELKDFKAKVDNMKNTIDLQINRISFLEEVKIVKEQLEKKR